MQTPTSLILDHQRSLSGNKGKSKLQQRMCIFASTGVFFFLCFGLISFSLAVSKSITYPATQCCHIPDDFWLELPSWTFIALFPDSHISQLFPSCWNCCPYCRKELYWRGTHKIAVPFSCKNISLGQEEWHSSCLWSINWEGCVWTVSFVIQEILGFP